MTDEGYACRFAVDSVEAARTIIGHLSRSFAFQTSDPMLQDTQPALCIFRVAYGSELTLKHLVRLLSSVPGLRLQIASTARSRSSLNSKGRP